MGVKISPRLRKKIASINETVEAKIEQRLLAIAQDLVLISPVRTGAFVNSWSFKDSLSRGRSKSSAGKPRVAADSARGKALNELVNDILKFVDEDRVSATGQYYFMNKAPHANMVDLKRGIVAQIRNIHG